MITKLTPWSNSSEGGA